MNQEIKEVYKEDTVGRKYHNTIVSKNKPTPKVDSSDPISININEPITYQELKTLSDSTKKLYIKSLHDNYKITHKDLSNMLGIHPATLYRSVMIPLNLKGLFNSKGVKKTEEDRLKWEKFLNKDNDEVKTEPVETKEERVPEVSNITVDNFKFELVGKLDMNDLVSKITAFVGNGTNCDIKVSVKVLKEGDL